MLCRFLLLIPLHTAFRLSTHTFFICDSRCSTRPADSTPHRKTLSLPYLLDARFDLHDHGDPIMSSMDFTDEQ